MNKAPPIYSENTIYKETPYLTELFPLDDYSQLPSIQQVQAVCFLNENQVVFYKNIEGRYGNPGGSIEQNESIEETLARELVEEASLKLIKCTPIGYEKVTNLKTNEISYFLRMVALVELLDEPINDPCNKAIDRIVVNYENAAQTLNWGKKGELLITLGKNHLKI